MFIQAIHIYNFLEFAQLRGCSYSQLISEVHDIPDLSIVPPENALIHQDDFYKVLRNINDCLNEENWGIHAGRFLNLKLLGLIYNISKEVTTIGEAFYYLQSYLKNTFPIIEANASASSDNYKILLAISNQEEVLNKIILENTLTIISRELQMMAGNSFEFALSSPHVCALYPSHWKLADGYAIEFQPFILKAEIQDKSSMQLDLLVPEYLKLIESLKEEASFKSRVKIAALNLANPELPAIQDIAEVFNLTLRTLQRKLGAENITYRGIIEELKKEICLLLLQHKKFSISDISYSLGYSEPASFYHSFKKWYDSTPEQMRMEVLSKIKSF